MTTTYSASSQKINLKNRWARDDVSMKIIAFQSSKEKVSQREFAKKTGVPRTTFQNWLDLIQLSSCVAASYGTHQKISDQMDAIIGQFGDMEKTRLSMLMPKKLITLCEDETFHPQICLVAIEPDSNYIILEKYENKRSGATWNQAVSETIGNLPVKVIQGTSDEEQGLIACYQRAELSSFPGAFSCNV